MYLQLEEFKNSNASFVPPVRHNGEPMELHSLDMAGPYMVARYANPVPVEGNRMEHFLIDIYINQEGREIFRVSSKVIEPPPPRPDLRTRLRYAMRLLFS